MLSPEFQARRPCHQGSARGTVRVKRGLPRPVVGPRAHEMELTGHWPDASLYGCPVPEQPRRDDPD